jgi:hypothetical protein
MRDFGYEKGTAVVSGPELAIVLLGPRIYAPSRTECMLNAFFVEFPPG